MKPTITMMMMMMVFSLSCMLGLVAVVDGVPTISFEPTTVIFNAPFRVTITPESSSTAMTVTSVFVSSSNTCGVPVQGGGPVSVTASGTATFTSVPEGNLISPQSGGSSVEVYLCDSTSLTLLATKEMHRISYTPRWAYQSVPTQVNFTQGTISTPSSTVQLRSFSDCSLGSPILESVISSSTGMSMIVNLPSTQNLFVCVQFVSTVTSTVITINTGQFYIVGAVGFAPNVAIRHETLTFSISGSAQANTQVAISSTSTCNEFTQGPYRATSNFGKSMTLRIEETPRGVAYFCIEHPFNTSIYVSAGQLMVSEYGFQPSTLYGDRTTAFTPILDTPTNTEVVLVNSADSCNVLPYVLGPTLIPSGVPQSEAAFPWVPTNIVSGKTYFTCVKKPGTTSNFIEASSHVIYKLPVLLYSRNDLIRGLPFVIQVTSAAVSSTRVMISIAGNCAMVLQEGNSTGEDGSNSLSVYEYNVPVDLLQYQISICIMSPDYSARYEMRKFNVRNFAVSHDAIIERRPTTFYFDSAIDEGTIGMFSALPTCVGDTTVPEFNMSATQPTQTHYLNRTGVNYLCVKRQVGASLSQAGIATAVFKSVTTVFVHTAPIITPLHIFAKKMETVHVTNIPKNSSLFIVDFGVSGWSSCTDAASSGVGHFTVYNSTELFLSSSSSSTVPDFVDVDVPWGTNISSSKWDVCATFPKSTMTAMTVETEWKSLVRNCADKLTMTSTLITHTPTVLMPDRAVELKLSFPPNTGMGISAAVQRDALFPPLSTLPLGQADDSETIVANLYIISSHITSSSSSACTAMSADDAIFQASVVASKAVKRDEWVLSGAGSHQVIWSNFMVTNQAILDQQQLNNNTERRFHVCLNQTTALSAASRAEFVNVGDIDVMKSFEVSTSGDPLATDGGSTSSSSSSSVAFIGIPFSFKLNISAGSTFFIPSVYTLVPFGSNCMFDARYAMGAINTVSGVSDTMIANTSMWHDICIRLNDGVSFVSIFTKFIYELSAAPTTITVGQVGVVFTLSVSLHSSGAPALPTNLPAEWDVNTLFTAYLVESSSNCSSSVVKVLPSVGLEIPIGFYTLCAKYKTATEYTSLVSNKVKLISEYTATWITKGSIRSFVPFSMTISGGDPGNMTNATTVFYVLPDEGETCSDASGVVGGKKKRGLVHSPISRTVSMLATAKQFSNVEFCVFTPDNTSVVSVGNDKLQPYMFPYSLVIGQRTIVTSGAVEQGWAKYSFDSNCSAASDGGDGGVVSVITNYKVELWVPSTQEKGEAFYCEKSKVKFDGTIVTLEDTSTLFIAKGILTLLPSFDSNVSTPGSTPPPPGTPTTPQPPGSPPTTPSPNLVVVVTSNTTVLPGVPFTVTVDPSSGSNPFLSRTHDCLQPVDTSVTGYVPTENEIVQFYVCVTSPDGTVIYTNTQPSVFIQNYALKPKRIFSTEVHTEQLWLSNTAITRSSSSGVYISNSSSCVFEELGADELFESSTATTTTSKMTVALATPGVKYICVKMRANAAGSYSTLDGKAIVSITSFLVVEPPRMTGVLVGGSSLFTTTEAANGLLSVGVAGVPICVRLQVESNTYHLSSPTEPKALSDAYFPLGGGDNSVWSHRAVYARRRSTSSDDINNICDPIGRRSEKISHSEFSVVPQTHTEEDGSAVACIPTEYLLHYETTAEERQAGGGVIQVSLCAGTPWGPQQVRIPKPVHQNMNSSSSYFNLSIVALSPQGGNVVSGSVLYNLGSDDASSSAVDPFRLTPYRGGTCALSKPPMTLPSSASTGSSSSLLLTDEQVLQEYRQWKEALCSAISSEFFNISSTAGLDHETSAGFRLVKNLMSSTLSPSSSSSVFMDEGVYDICCSTTSPSPSPSAMTFKPISQLRVHAPEYFSISGTLELISGVTTTVSLLENLTFTALAKAFYYDPACQQEVALGQITASSSSSSAEKEAILRPVIPASDPRESLQLYLCARAAVNFTRLPALGGGSSSRSLTVRRFTPVQFAKTTRLCEQTPVGFTSTAAATAGLDFNTPGVQLFLSTSPGCCMSNVVRMSEVQFAPSASGSHLLRQLSVTQKTLDLYSPHTAFRVCYHFNASLSSSSAVNSCLDLGMITVSGTECNATTAGSSSAGGIGRSTGGTTIGGAVPDSAANGEEENSSILGILIGIFIAIAVLVILIALIHYLVKGRKVVPEDPPANEALDAEPNMWKKRFDEMMTESERSKAPKFQALHSILNVPVDMKLNLCYEATPAIIDLMGQEEDVRNDIEDTRDGLYEHIYAAFIAERNDIENFALVAERSEMLAKISEINFEELNELLHQEYEDRLAIEASEDSVRLSAADVETRQWREIMNFEGVQLRHALEEDPYWRKRRKELKRANIRALQTIQNDEDDEEEDDEDAYIGVPREQFETPPAFSPREDDHNSRVRSGRKRIVQQQQQQQRQGRSPHQGGEGRSSYRRSNQQHSVHSSNSTNLRDPSTGMW